ncbi:hypothetical protein [Streptomyces sp. NPDC056188]|uniref:hypothetical protein n=1 Tax=Streptomyces sp. NPDC056188 TaxID=3345740 RepID=UPI0035D6966F
MAHIFGGFRQAYVPGMFLTAADLGGEPAAAEHAEFRTVLLDGDGSPVVPGGTVGDQVGESGAGRWNLDLGETDPLLSAEGGGEAPVAVELPCFEAPDGGAGVLRCGVPVRRSIGAEPYSCSRSWCRRCGCWTPATRPRQAIPPRILPSFFSSLCHWHARASM